MTRLAGDKPRPSFKKTAVIILNGRYFFGLHYANILYLCVFCIGCACSSFSNRLIGFPPSYTYDWISSKKIAFAKPIVVSSEIYYENRFTNQSYHSIDKNRTADAFYRDFLQKTVKKHLDWHCVDQKADSCIQRKLADARAPLDSLPRECLGFLRSNNIEIFVCIYAMRLYHMQFVGIRPSAEGSAQSYSTIIKKNVDYYVTIFDVAANRPLFMIPMKKEQNNISLNIMEYTVEDLFSALLRKRN